MMNFVVDLVEERVDLDESQFSESILERWYSTYTSKRNVTVLEFGSPCPSRSPSSMISNGSFRSLTKCFISNVERFAFMSRTCLRTIRHINHVVRDNGSFRSLMCPFNVEILSFFRWTCLNYTCLMNRFPVTGRSVRSEELSSSRKELTSISWERDVFFHLALRSRHAWYRVVRSLTNWI